MFKKSGSKLCKTEGLSQKLLTINMPVNVGFPHFLDLEYQGWGVPFTSFLPPFKIKNFVSEEDMLSLKKNATNIWGISRETTSIGNTASQKMELPFLDIF